ncbi:MAG TPA: response regulator [Holophagaceae bacterium]|nr:response regulator [Holophagaceae bacterium]
MQVLVVDDDIEVLRQLGRLFHRAGHGVEFNAAEDEALALASTGRFDCLVVSTRVANFSGLRLLWALRQEDERTPVIMIVPSSASADRRHECLTLGADDCLSLPICPQELLLRVQAVVRRSGWGSAPMEAAQGM